MDFQIHRLEDYIRTYKAGGDAKTYSDQIKKLVREISESKSMSAVHTDRLLNILQLLYNDQGLKWSVYEPLNDEIKKIWGLIRRGREALASSFYLANGHDTKAVDCINLREDVTIINLSMGTTLYQWCKFIIVNGKETIYDPDSGFTTVGEYFTFNKVPQEQLGISPYFDLYELKLKKAYENLEAFKSSEKAYAKKNYSIGKKICCQFVLPFSAKALVSTSKSCFDTWSHQRASNGSRIEAPWFAIGGAKQVFIPLNTSQKQMLAQTLLFA